MFGCLRATVELLQRCRVRGVARHKGVRVDTKIVLNWLLASTATNTSQIGVNFKQTEHEERVGQAKAEEGDPEIMVN